MLGDSEVLEEGLGAFFCRTLAGSPFNGDKPPPPRHIVTLSSSLSSPSLLAKMSPHLDRPSFWYVLVIKSHCVRLKITAQYFTIYPRFGWYNIPHKKWTTYSNYLTFLVTPQYLPSLAGIRSPIKNGHAHFMIRFTPVP